MVEKLDPIEIKDQIEKEAYALLEGSLTSFGKPEQDAGVVDNGKQKPEVKKEKKAEKLLPEQFEKTKENKIVKETVEGFLEKNKALKNVDEGEFTDKVVNRLLRYGKSVDKDGRPVKKGEVGISIEDIIEKPEHAAMLALLINGAAKTESEHILGNTASSAKSKKEKAPDKPLTPEELEKKKEEKKLQEKEVTDPQEKILRDKVDAKRNEFAKTEYCEKEATQRIRQFFDKFSKEKKYEENATVKSCREDYERSLKEYKDYQIEKLKYKNLSGKDLEVEVKKIFSSYNLGETIKYYDARTKAKMDYLAEKEDKGGKEKSFGKKWLGKARLGCAKAGDFYNKQIPTSVKIGLGVAALATGAYSLIALRRATGAFIMMATGGSQLDKVGQFVDAMRNKREENKVYKEIENSADRKIDFGKLSVILDGKINNIDDKLNNKNIRSGISKVSAVVLAGLLGYTAVNAITDFMEHKESFSNSGVSGFIRKLISDKVEANNLAGAPKGNPFDYDHLNKSAIENYQQDSIQPSGNVLSNVGVQDIAENKTDVLTPMPENVPSAETSSLVIEKGSSIEGTLIKQLKELGIENPGAKAHSMWLNYMDTNKAEIIKNVGKEEYAKMLKDGMVNVKPGTGLEIASDGKGGFKLTDIKGSISHIEPKGFDVASSHRAPFSGMLSQEIIQGGPKVSDFVEQRNDIMAKILDTQGKLKELNIKHNALFANSVNANEFDMTSKLVDATDLEKEIEHLNGELQEHNSKLHGLNSAIEGGSDGAKTGEIRSAIKNVTPSVNEVGPSGGKTFTISEIATEKNDRIMFEKVFGRVGNYDKLSDSLSDMGAGEIREIPKSLDGFNKQMISAENSRTILRAIFGENVNTTELAKELNKESVGKIFESAKSKEDFFSRYDISGKNREIFEKMAKAFNPKSAIASNNNMHRWITRVAYAAGRVKSMETFDTTGF